mgnify:CR=1 FL=1
MSAVSEVNEALKYTSLALKPVALRHAERLDALEAELAGWKLFADELISFDPNNEDEIKDAATEIARRFHEMKAENERLRAELATARNDALLNEQDAMRWRKFISFDCLALHLPILRANPIWQGKNTADAMDRLIDAIDCEPAIRTLKREGGGT